jgi:vacuolar protein sorting-associated protein 13A/C
LQFVGKNWEQLRNIGVDAVGEFTYSLRPRTDSTHDRLLCEVALAGNIKVVTLRSTYKVVNQTMYPLELTLVDESGQPVCAVKKLGELLIWQSTTI